MLLCASPRGSSLAMPTGGAAQGTGVWGVGIGEGGDKEAVGVLGRVAQAVFAAYALAAFTACYAVCAVACAALPKDKAQAVCVAACNWAFWFPTSFVCPWVRVEDTTGGRAWEELGAVMREKGVCVLLNHTSFMDTLVFVGYAPLDLLYSMRTLMSSKLFKIPLLGSIARMVGHQPVYFLRNEEGQFSLDKERMKETNKNVAAHLDGGGSLVVFPEGQLNARPETLLSFRRGTFATAIERGLPLWGLVFVGCDKTWPLSEAIGGLPGDVRFALFPIMDTYAPGATSQEVSDISRNAMQAQLDALRTAGAAAAAATGPHAHAG